MDSAQSEEATVNQWIFSELDFWYFWREEMPTDTDLSLAPEDYFDALKFSGDRFSVLVPDYQTLINSLDGVVLEAGYELSLFLESGTNNVLGAVTYVKGNSPAENAGLKRGDLVRAINGVQMDTDNFREVLSDISQNHSLEYLRFNEMSGEYDTEFVDVSVVQLAENPNFMDTTYTTQNGKKVGYYVYNFFSRGVGDGQEYASQMDAIFEGFKSGGIEELVLDLRYNGGGSVNAATELASLIAPGVSQDDNFYLYEWNDRVEESIRNDPKVTDPESFFRGPFLDKSANIGDQLTSDRIYVLTGRATASASELIINGLAPYLNVIIIGDTTVGKNVGSFPIEDDDNPDNNYGLLPIVFQISNNLGQSNYAEGFVPGPQYLVNDLQLPLRALGDVQEPLLATALADVDGQLTGRMRRADTGHHALITTQELKPFRNDMILDHPFSKKD